MRRAECKKKNKITFQKRHEDMRTSMKIFLFSFVIVVVIIAVTVILAKRTVQNNAVQNDTQNVAAGSSTPPPVVRYPDVRSPDVRSPDVRSPDVRSPVANVQPSPTKPFVSVHGVANVSPISIPIPTSTMAVKLLSLTSSPSLPTRPAKFTKTLMNKPPFPQHCRTYVGNVKKVYTCTYGLFSLSGKGPDGSITVTLSSHLAGGIYALNYAGTDFVLPVPITGASMQSAIFMDGGSYNPTSNGAWKDAGTGISTSKLVDFRADATKVYTSVMAAEYLPPGIWDARRQHYTPYTYEVSDVRMSKLLEFVGNGEMQYTVSMTIPPNKYTQATVAPYSAWVPYASSAQMLGYVDGVWTTLLRWCEQINGHNHPTAIAVGNADGSRAYSMVLVQWPYLPKWNIKNVPMIGHGDVEIQNNWRKWNVTHPFTARGIDGGEYVWKMHMFFGTMDIVKKRAANIAFKTLTNSPM